jgi:chorismate synthase
MSINIVKGVEFGLGFEQTRRFGSAVHDVIDGRDDAGRWVHRSNNAGGLTGGVTNGEPLVVRGAVKPISTLARPLPSADLITGEAVEKAHYERSDISVVPAAGIVGEAMVMLTLAASSSRRSAGTPWPTLPPTSPRTGQGSRSRSTHRKPAALAW